jgi:hypothetical protein
LPDLRITNDEANEIDPVDDREPAISPDGTRLVFVRRGANGNDDIYMVNTLQDPTRPGFAPRMFKLVGDVDGNSPSTERRPSWTPDGRRIVFQSNRGPLKTLPNGSKQTERDFDIYMVSVPDTATTANTPLAETALVQLTTAIGDDVEPSVGPLVEQYKVARPNGQLVYASRRDDLNNSEDVYTNPGLQIEVEDYDIYLQDLSQENKTTNRAQRITDTERDVFFVLGYTGDSPNGIGGGIDPNEPTNADDSYYVDIAVSGDERRPTFTADGLQVIMCSDSRFFAPIPGGPAIKDLNPDDDFDIVRVDINSRGFQRLTNDAPTRTYVARTGPIIDVGNLSVSEDYEPYAASTPDSATVSAGQLESGNTTNSGSNIRRPSSRRGRQPTIRSGRSRSRHGRD